MCTLSLALIFCLSSNIANTLIYSPPPLDDAVHHSIAHDKLLSITESICVQNQQPIEKLNVILGQSLPKTCRLLNFQSKMFQLDLDKGIVFVRSKLCFSAQRPLITDILYVSYTCTFVDIGNKTTQEFRVTLNLMHSGVLKISSNRQRRQLQRIRAVENDLRFEQPSYTVNVSEEQPAGIQILTVLAINPDKIPLSYSMLALRDGRSNGLFKINRTTGAIVTTAKLDRESMSTHYFRLSAHEIGNSLRMTSVELIVHVDDVNDHEPLFNKRLYPLAISESTEVGSVIIRVSAIDKDSGINGEVRYSIINLQDNEEFDIDPVSGAITLKSSLDRERKSFYRIKIMSRDQANFDRKHGSALVEITVNDVNDNYPQFDRDQYLVDVLEDIDYTKNPVITRVKATDKDVDDNAKLHYSFVSGNYANVFAIDYETGDVSVTQPLDHRKSPHYELVVRAKDSGLDVQLTNTTMLFITVIDVNNHAPQFFNAYFQQSVMEDVPVGYRVLKVQAYDVDSGANAEIRYSITDKNVTKSDTQKQQIIYFPFKIDPLRGWITVSEKLDRETASEIEFTVKAADLGQPVSLFTTVKVHIIILDINDNAPEFEHEFYNVTVPEDAKAGYDIITVQAKDPDDTSGLLSYIITEGNDDNLFLVVHKQDAAAITLNGNQKLDFKQRKLYTLNIKASDSGGKSDTATVYIRVEDVNSRPYFEQKLLSARVSESEPVGFPVLVAQAYDNDEGSNAYLSYSLIGSNQFAINPESGVLTIASLLDRELINKYSLQVVVLDAGNPSLSSTADIEIEVLDVNDNAPKFLLENYSASIAEDVVIGTVVLTVEARDIDLGNNSRVRYRLQPSIGLTTALPFEIDSNLGNVRVVAALDREKVAQHLIVVEAYDAGVPVLYSSATIIINVIDIDDNPPKFDLDHYNIYVPENTAIGTVIGHIVAKDADAGINALVSYRILSGQDSSLFSLQEPLDKDGIDIVIRTDTDFESGNILFHFQLKASSSMPTSIAEVSVHVLDANDHKPVLKDFMIVFNNYRSDYAVNELGKVPAHDPDINDTLHYSIAKGNQVGLIRLHPETGIIRLDSNLNIDQHIQAEMKVCVSDGANTACVHCWLQVMHVSEQLLLNSVTIRVNDATPEHILSPATFTSFLDAIASLHPSRRNDVAVFNVRQDAEIDQNHLILNISFGVRDPKTDKWITAEELRELISINRVPLAELTALQILPFEDNLCVQEPCENFQRCQTSHRIANADDIISTDDFIFRPINPGDRIVCVCPPGFAGMQHSLACDTEVNMCYSSPCRNNGTCQPKEGGFICLCPESHTGLQCEVPLESLFCLSGICKGGSTCRVNERNRIICQNCRFPIEYSTSFCELTARSFAKHPHGSFVAFLPLKQRYHFRIELSFATLEPNGIIFYNGRYQAKHDFVALELVEGRLQFSFSLGEERPTIAYLESELPLNNGQWHSVVVDYFNKSVTVSADGCDVEISLRFGELKGYKKCAVRVSRERDRKCSDTSMCYRLLDLEGPFYLGGLPTTSKRAQYSVIKDWFDGCIKDVYLDRKLLDLSGFVSERNSVAGCGHLKDRCGAVEPCANEHGCRNLWGAHKCECLESFGGQNCTNESPMPVHLRGMDSYVQWSVPVHWNAMPFHIGLDVKTRQQTAILLSVHFDNDHQILFKLLDGHVMLDYNGLEMLVSGGPKVNDAGWHNLQAFLSNNAIEITLDYAVSQKFQLSNTFYATPTRIFTGRLSDSSDEYGFMGCVKSVFAGNMPNQYLTATDNHYSSAGCEQPNRCLDHQHYPCPASSYCVSEWDSFRCNCFRGHLGSDCVHVCSLKPCQNGGHCMPSTNALGYQCFCPQGYSGQHCEVTLPAQCPKAWWGYPTSCGPCSCNVAKNFDPNCDQQSGLCHCKKGFYQPEHSDRCVACDCLFPNGAEHRQCEAGSGECRCRGNADGRQCNQCSNKFAAVNASGWCEVYEHGCPENYRQGILWKNVHFGTLAKETCPPGATGEAVRQCLADIGWEAPNLYNCTSIRFLPLSSRLSELDSGLQWSSPLVESTAVELANATADDVHSQALFGKDLYIAYRLLMSMVRHELSQHGLQLSHSRDRRFIRSVVKSASSLTNPDYSEWWQQLASGHEFEGVVAANFLESFSNYGSHLGQQFSLTYMQPTFVNEPNFVFVLDSLHQSTDSTSTDLQLPKFDNFMQPANVQSGLIGGVSVWLELSQFKEMRPKVVFYALFRTLGSLLPDEHDQSVRPQLGSSLIINSPVFSIALFDANSQQMHELLQPMRIRFSLERWHNVSRPQCVYWVADRNKGFWSAAGCKVVSTNLTSVVCDCHVLGNLAVVMEATKFNFRVTFDSVLTYFFPAAMALSILLLIVTLTVRIGVRVLKSNSNCILIVIIGCMIVSLLAFLFVVMANQSEYLCKVVGLMLHFVYLALFIWLFLSQTHAYRMMTDIRDLNHDAPIWPYHLFAWSVSFFVVSLTAVVHFDSYGHRDFCWFSLQDRYAYTMIGPVTVFMLFAVYVLSMCLMVAYSKDWEVIGSKMRSHVIKYAILALLCLICWNLAMFSLNWQLLGLHYAYCIACIASSVYVLMAFVVFEPQVTLTLMHHHKKSKNDIDHLHAKPNGHANTANDRLNTYGDIGMSTSSRPVSPSALLSPNISELDSASQCFVPNQSSCKAEQIDDLMLSGLPNLECSPLTARKSMSRDVLDLKPERQPFASGLNTNSCDRRSPSRRPFTFDQRVLSKPDLIPSPECQTLTPQSTSTLQCSPVHSDISTVPRYATVYKSPFQRPSYISPYSGTTPFATFGSRQILSPAPQVLGMPNSGCEFDNQSLKNFDCKFSSLDSGRYSNAGSSSTFRNSQQLSASSTTNSFANAGPTAADGTKPVAMTLPFKQQQLCNP